MMITCEIENPYYINNHVSTDREIFNTRISFENQTFDDYKFHLSPIKHIFSSTEQG